MRRLERDRASEALKIAMIGPENSHDRRNDDPYNAAAITSVNGVLDARTACRSRAPMRAKEEGHELTDDPGRLPL